jgi:asparagine synthase (glutamine-hydrolysing)
VSRDAGQALDLHAFTVVYDRLIPDTERYWSGLAAGDLGIPITYLAADGYLPFQNAGAPWLRTPEPVDESRPALGYDLGCLAGRHAPVALVGYGGDPALYPSAGYLPRLLRRAQVGRALADVGRCYRLLGRFPPLYMRSSLLRRIRETPDAPPAELPRWLQPDLADRLRRHPRLAWDDRPERARHPARPEAYRFLASPFWVDAFQGSDPPATGLPLGQRYPFFDIRLVAFLLRLPPMPWCVDKAILRQAMRGRLPEPIRTRRKSPLAADPVGVGLRLQRPPWPPPGGTGTQLERFVSLEVARGLFEQPEGLDPVSRDATRALALASWLQHVT